MAAMPERNMKAELSAKESLGVSFPYGLQFHVVVTWL